MEYKGKLKGFPKEVVEKMLERQEEQGNARDISVFEKSPMIDRISGGFNWEKSIEHSAFWREVLYKKNFKIFFDKYPTLDQKILNLPLEEKKSLLNLLTDNIKEEESVKVGDFVVTSTGIIGVVGTINKSAYPYKIGNDWYCKVNKIDPNKTVKEILG